MWESMARLKQSRTWNSMDSTDKLAAVTTRVPKLKSPFLLGFPCQDCCDCRWAPAVPAPVAKVTFAGLSLHAADVDSCRQMAKDKAQSLNTTCDLLTLPTICCLILGKCTETLIKILILFHGWPTCGMNILHPSYICSSRAVVWCLRLPPETGPVNVQVSLPYFLKALSKVITSYWFTYGQLMKSQALSHKEIVTTVMSLL